MRKKSNRGFTLVELIVVLVILAILASILIPALLGYIDRARKQKDLLAAKNCLTAAQAELSYVYGKNVEIKNYSVFGVGTPGKKNHDMEMSKTDVAKRILATADDNPYLFMVCTGNNDPTIMSKNPDMTKHDCYTVYLAMYLKEKDGEPLYYYDGKWTRKNPSNAQYYAGGDGGNVCKVNGRKIALQYYVIANKGNLSVDGSLWTYIKGKLDEEK